MIKSESNEWANKEVAINLGYLTDIKVNHSHNDFLSWISNNPNRVILDVGCGNGNLYHLMKCGKYNGIDVNPHNIEFARSNVTSPDIFTCGNVEEFDISPFDVLYFDSTLSFLKNPLSLLSKFHKQGNIVFLTRLKLDSSTFVSYYTWAGMNNPSHNWSFCLVDFEKLGYSVTCIGSSYILEAK